MVYIINIYPKYIKEQLKELGGIKIHRAKLYKTKSEHHIIREKWMLDGNKVSFDTLPGLSTTLYIKSKDEFIINKIITDLNIENLPSVNSYSNHYEYYYGIKSINKIDTLTFNNASKLLLSKVAKNKQIMKNTIKLQKKKYYKALIPDKVNYTSTVSEPWFSYIASGKKTIEGRLNKGTFKLMQIGEIVKWINKDKEVLTKIINIKKYNSFDEYLTKESIRNCLPGITDINKGVEIYRKYYSIDDEKRYGVLAIHIELLN